MRNSMERIKCCVIGDAGVGKTSLIHAFMDKPVEQLQSTMGIDFFSKTMYIQEKNVRLSIWDTAGAEQYHSLMHSYVRDAQIILIVYDISTKQSILKWLQIAAQYAPTVLGIIGNKDDLTAVSHNLTDILAPWERQSWLVVSETCSSRHPTSVKKIFVKCVEKAVNRDKKVEKNTYITFQKQLPQKHKCCT